MPTSGLAPGAASNVVIIALSDEYDRPKRLYLVIWTEGFCYASIKICACGTKIALAAACLVLKPENKPPAPSTHMICTLSGIRTIQTDALVYTLRKAPAIYDC